MKVLYNWLREFVPLEISPQETAAVLTRLGFEIAGVEVFGGRLNGVVVAEVQEVQKHPNADRLSVCKVFDGQTAFSVVCGAPNVRAGIRVPLARVGAVLPNGEVLRAAKLRGVDSQGMICSAAELGLEEKSAGIMILDAAAPIGTDVRPLLGLDDALIEIETTPNRRDALSVLGIAREVAAGLGLALKQPEPRVRELDLPQSVTVLNEALDLCPRYIARTLRDIKIAPAPEWMVRRLTRCGIRSINNVVDITNYVMLELGQPLHAFDANKLNGRQLRVRRALEGETLLTLEGKTAILKEGMLVIADDKKPVALAGIMGGEESAITDGTSEVVIESAAFAPAPIRLTSKALGITSESAYRFERGSDWNAVAIASRRAAQLIQELAGGLGCKPAERSGPTPPTATIKMRTERMRQLLGADIKDAAAADMFRRLGCEINMGTGQLAIAVPSWRLDLTMEADLVEEVARLYGYDNIPNRVPSIRPTAVPEDRLWAYERRLASTLAGLGLLEASNYSFLSNRQVQPYIPGFGQASDARPVAIANPLSQEQAMLRTNMLPALLQNITLNAHRQAAGVRLFEMGRIYFQDKEGRHEQRRLGIVLWGEYAAPHWREKKRKTDFYDLSGLIEGLLRALHIPSFQLTRYPMAPFHPKKSCAILAGTRVLGWMGEVHPMILQDIDLGESVLAAELDVTALKDATPDMLAYAAPSVFPPVRRDLSFVVPQETTYERILKTLRTATGPLLASVTPIDVFTGEKIGAGKKSMTVTLVFRHQERTLTDAEIEVLMKKAVADLERKCEAVLRQ
jgi:phenylalanyl-tRNA synthetase beta chain